MDNNTHQIRMEQWTAIINECLASGMKKTAWCRINGISDKQFFYWQRKIRNSTCQQLQSSGNILPVIAECNSGIMAAHEAQTGFVELTPPAPERDPCSGFCPDVVVHSGSITLEISNSASKELLSALGGILHAQ